MSLHQVASLAAAFITALASNQAPQTGSLQSDVTTSGTYFDTFISAMKMEGSYYLKKPCYDNPPSAACQVGCPWTELVPQKFIAVSSGHDPTYDTIGLTHPEPRAAVRVPRPHEPYFPSRHPLACSRITTSQDSRLTNLPSPAPPLACPSQGLNDTQIVVTDGFHPTNEFYPIDPLPHATSTCSDPTNCPVLNFMTATEAYYGANPVTPLDTGYNYESADELRAKLSSRWVAGMGLGDGLLDSTPS